MLFFSPQRRKLVKLNDGDKIPASWVKVPDDFVYEGNRLARAKFEGWCSICGERHVKQGDSVIQHPGLRTIWADLGCYQLWKALRQAKSGV
jgi:hypothetical protein